MLKKVYKYWLDGSWMIPRLVDGDESDSSPICNRKHKGDDNFYLFTFDLTFSNFYEHKIFASYLRYDLVLLTAMNLVFRRIANLLFPYSDIL